MGDRPPCRRQRSGWVSREDGLDIERHICLRFGVGQLGGGQNWVKGGVEKSGFGD